jgi:predicted outer membrane repeat protein
VVHPDGTGDFPTIQAAVDACVDGDVVELTDGTFTGDGNRDIDFQGKAITVRSQSGVPQLCIIDCQGSEADPRRAFYFHSDEGPDAVVEGITITGGHTSGWEWPYSCGAGILCWDTSPTIRSCVFTGNSTGHYGSGGGLWCNGSQSLITECTFDGNHAAGHGGALQSSYSDIHVHSCIFIGNTCEWDGGAVWIMEASLLLEDCLFQANAGTEGGAIKCYFRSSTSLETVTLFQNVATESGGAICIGEYCDASLRECTLAANSSDASGGSLSCAEGGIALVSNTIICGSPQGASVDCGVGSLTLTCCDIHGNQGGDWVDCIEDQLGSEGNIRLDPLFCDPENGDLTLEECSPCAPFSPPNPECDLIGAWPVGCGGTPVTETTWGGVKALFKE